MGWFVVLVLCQEAEPARLRAPDPPAELLDWSPLRSFDAAAFAFFTGEEAPDPGYGVGAKLRVWDAEAQSFDLSLAGFAKIPFGRDRALPYGDLTDVALAAVARIPVGPSAFHLHLGTTVPFGQEDLARRAPDAELASFAFAGAGFSWRVADAVAFGVQVEANTSAFRDVDLLQRHPASAVFGARAIWGDLVFEAGLGAGFDRMSGTPWMAFASVGLRF